MNRVGRDVESRRAPVGSVNVNMPTMRCMTSSSRRSTWGTATILSRGFGPLVRYFGPCHHSVLSTKCMALHSRERISAGLECW